MYVPVKESLALLVLLAFSNGSPIKHCAKRRCNKAAYFLQKKRKIFRNSVYFFAILGYNKKAGIYNVRKFAFFRPKKGG